jgi:hypothetical protein
MTAPAARRLRASAADSGLACARRDVEELVLLTVEDGVEDEVAGGRGLPFGDERHELLLAHRGAGVVGEPLHADRGLPFGGQVLAARRAGSVRGEDPDLVRQAHQLVLHAVVEHAAKLVRLQAQGGQQVGPADVADEQRVAGQHSVRDRVAGMLVHQDADGFRGVAGGLDDFEHDLAQGDAVAVG